ncbi:hypothetical protein TNCV_2824051 [Trichonephila clavipes]|nr:hypothetical protein TNCV_2824051 [Trichonephila clavipes]
METNVVIMNYSQTEKRTPELTSRSANFHTIITVGPLYNEVAVTSLLRNINSGRLLCGPDTHTCILQLQRNPCLTPEESSPSTGR